MFSLQYQVVRGIGVQPKKVPTPTAVYPGGQSQHGVVEKRRRRRRDTATDRMEKTKVYSGHRFGTFVDKHAPQPVVPSMRHCELAVARESDQSFGFNHALPLARLQVTVK